MLTANNPRDGYLLLASSSPDWPAELDTDHAAWLGAAGAQLAVANGLVPGRYFQALAPGMHKQQDTNLRLFLESRTTREGWGLYCEQLLVELGLADGDPALRLVQAHRSLVANVRYAACIRLHTQGASVADAARLFEQAAFLSPETALLEARRCATDPLALSEALGKQLIIQLRADFQQASASTDLKSFHDRFLSGGALPVPLIREAMLAAPAE
jgi:uncharacterized protein (DUF885 family)